MLANRTSDVDTSFVTSFVTSSAAHFKSHGHTHCACRCCDADIQKGADSRCDPCVPQNNMQVPCLAACLRVWRASLAADPTVHLSHFLRNYSGRTSS